VSEWVTVREKLGKTGEEEVRHLVPDHEVRGWGKNLEYVPSERRGESARDYSKRVECGGGGVMGHLNKKKHSKSK